VQWSGSRRRNDLTSRTDVTKASGGRERYRNEPFVIEVVKVSVCNGWDVAPSPVCFIAQSSRMEE
jgi:hypothetical protein